MRRNRAGRVVPAVVAAALLAGCTAPAADPGTPTAPVGAPSASATPARTLTGDKKATGQALPAQVAGWTLDRRQTAGGAASGFYTRPGAQGDLVITLTPVPLTDDALAHALDDPQPVGAATCGVLPGAGTTACYRPLEGGNLRVAGALPVADLAAVADAVHATLK
nr:hypothetical protein [Propionibacterium sp.]